MNREVIERIGELHPPPAHARSFGSSVALNMFVGEGGSVYMLCDDGCIRYIDLARKEGSENCTNVTKTLVLDNTDSLLDMGISGIEFNFSGSILLLTGPSALGVVILRKFDPQSSGSVEEDGPESMSGSAHQLVVMYRAHNHRDEIVKAVWHPLSDRHVVVLLRCNKLLMFDVVEGKESEFLLDSSKTYTSFCFGPSEDWLSMSVFLLDSSAGISCMCPLLPTGAVVPADTILDLHEWLSDLAMDGPSHSYLKRVDSYLRAAFGGSSADNQGGEHGQLRRAGIFGGRPLSEEHALHEYFYRQPLLQGPLVVEGRLKKRSRSQEGASVPCDICVPSPAGEHGSPPVFVVSWSDGVVEQFVLSTAFGPSWSGAVSFSDTGGQDMEEALRFGTPSLVHVETLCLVEEGSADNFYELRSDPLSASNFHVTARSTGECFLLHLNWIDDQEAGDQQQALVQESSARLIFRHPHPGRGISGQMLVSDPVIGHVTLLRCDDGYTVAVNLRVEQKMMMLDAKIVVRRPHIFLLSPSNTVETNICACVATVEGSAAARPLLPREHCRECHQPLN